MTDRGKRRSAGEAGAHGDDRNMEDGQQEPRLKRPVREQWQSDSGSDEPSTMATDVDNLIADYANSYGSAIAAAAVAATQCPNPPSRLRTANEKVGNFHYHYHNCCLMYIYNKINIKTVWKSNFILKDGQSFPKIPKNTRITKKNYEKKNTTVLNSIN